MSTSPIFEPIKCCGCVLCCQRDIITLLPHEYSKYLCEPHPLQPRGRMVAHKPNGDCIYLGDEGCTIHSNKPSRCREMDCRVIAMGLSAQKAQALADENKFNMAVYWRGNELLENGS